MNKVQLETQWKAYDTYIKNDEGSNKQGIHIITKKPENKLPGSQQRLPVPYSLTKSLTLVYHTFKDNPHISSYTLQTWLKYACNFKSNECIMHFTMSKVFIALNSICHLCKTNK